MDFSLYVYTFNPFIDLCYAVKSLLLNNSLASLHITGSHASVHEFLL